MIKTTQKVIVLTAMMMFGAMLVFAQAESPESNSSKATFGEIGTDVDNFLDSTAWKDVELGNIFAYSRFGANIPDGRLDIGAAFKFGGKGEAVEETPVAEGEEGEEGEKVKKSPFAGGLYVAVYYDGSVTGYTTAPAYHGKDVLEFAKGTDDEAIKALSVRAESKGNPQATYGVLVGLGNGMGIKFTYKDDLLVTGTGGQLGGDNGTYADKWEGTGTPSVEVGGSFGPISKIGLSVPIVYNRTESTTINGNTASYSTITTDWDEGNYVQPDIYLKMGLLGGALTIENNLRFNIYGVPAVKKGGGGTMQMGVADVTSTQTIGKNLATDESLSQLDVYMTRYDSRFFLEDCVAPSYNISGETGKFAYSVTAALPITFGWTAHSYGAKYQGPWQARGDSETTQKTYEIKGYDKSTDFNMSIAPAVSAGLQFKPLEVLTLQGGIYAEILEWAVASTSSSKVNDPADADDPSDAALDAHDAISTIPGVTLAYSEKESWTNFSFVYPKLSLAAGFTFDFKQKAALDVVFIKYVVPTAAGMVYKAVGDGLGSSETSVVLSIKL